MPLETGARLGPYEILSPIGAGGMGEVYQAKDTRLDRTVAIKVLPEHLAESPERKARFEREAKTISQLNHPHICTLYDVGEQNGLRLRQGYGGQVDFLVMEYIEGETLAERLKKGPLPLDKALEYGIQMADGLDTAHRAGIVHRDLKSGNVMVTPSGVKLLDFGLARLVRESLTEDDSDAPTQQRDLTEEQAIVGTLPYMAPEQLEGKRADHRADTWALGALLYEMVSGRRPFTGGSQASLVGSILKDDPPSLEGKRPFVPARLSLLLRRCLAKDPERRWQSAKDLALELEELSRAVERPEGVEGSSRSRLPALAWIGAIVATAILTALVVRLLPSPDGGSPDPPDVRLRQLTGRPESDTIQSAALSPDGESLAFATETGLFLQLVATGEEQQIPLPEELRVHEVDWLGDGSTLLLSAVSRGEIGLYRTSIFGGTPSKLSEEDAWRAAVSPGGAHIAYLQSHPSKAVRIMDVDGGNARTLAQAAGDDSFWEIAWSPDGRWLLMGRWGGSISPFDTVLEAIDVETGEMRPVMFEPRFFQNWRGFLPFAWAPDGRLIFARRELPPNEMTSNLWWAEIDLETARVRGDPGRLTQLVGSNVKDVSLTLDEPSLAFLLERNQNDIFVAGLAPDRTLRQTRRITTDERDDTSLGWTPDGQTILFESTRSGSLGLFRIGAKGEEQAKFLASKGGGVHFLETSPDGRTVTYWAGSALDRVPIAGGPVETVLTAGEWPGHSCSRTPYRCLVGERSADGSDYTLFELDWERGKGEEVLRFPNESPFTNWDLSPDGTRVVVGGGNARLRIFDLQTQEESVLEIDGWHYGEFPAWAADGRGIFVEGGLTSQGYFRKGLLYISLDGEVQSLRRNWSEWITHVAPSPDGTRIAFSSQRFTGNVWMLEGL